MVCLYFSADGVISDSHWGDTMLDCIFKGMVLPLNFSHLSTCLSEKGTKMCH